MYQRILFNYLGKGIPALISFLVTPKIIILLGYSDFGIISLFLSLTAIFLISDFGVGMKVIKILSSKNDIIDKAIINSLFHTYELFFLLVSICLLVVSYVIGQIIFTFYPQLFLDFKDYFLVLIVAVGLQILPVFYQSFLQGLDKQVILNSIIILMSSTRNLGGLFVLVFYENSLSTYFSWIVFSSILTILVFAVFIRKSCNLNKTRSNYDLSFFRLERKFSFYFFLSSIVAVIVGQLDKFIVLKILGFEMLGKYQVGLTFSSLIWMIILPFSSATLPFFSRLLNSGDNCIVHNTLHKYSQYFSSLIYPVIATFVIFADIFVSKYLQAHSLKDITLITNLAIFMVLGTTLNGICSLPGNFLLSKGLSKWLFNANLLQLILIAPISFFFIQKFGLFGAGISWLAINSVYFLIMIPSYLIKYMKGALWKWIFEDNFYPAVISFIVSFASYRLYVYYDYQINVFVFIGIQYFFNIILVTFSQQFSRKLIVDFVKK